MDLQVEKLVRLQQLDGNIRHLQEAIAAIPGHIGQLEQTLQLQIRAVEQAEKAVVAEDARRRRMESDLKDQQQKIVKYREQSSSVKTNEQFRAMQHEIGFVETEIRRIEDEELSSMVRSETLETERSDAKKELESRRKLIEREKQTAAAQASEKQKELDLLLKERSALRPSVDADLLEQYDLLASSPRKTPLARASGQRCLSCQMSLRPQFWNQVREGVLLHCESCGRLLYFDPRFDPLPETAPGTAKA
jgi:predicted  nucleic acid-binding Zn-ribbon protein